VTVDILWRRLSIRTQAIIDLCAYLLAFLFCSMLLWKGIDMVELSWRIKEVTITPARMPIYPIKAVLVVGAVLVLLQLLSKYISDIITAITNRRVEL
jgi:TRAP-type mannitol/chloroaromatic compound transport system permease small subunit